MTHLILICIVALVAGVYILTTTVRDGSKKTASRIELGYLAIIGAAFGLLAQWVSFAAVLLWFIAISGGIWLLDRMVLRRQRLPEATSPEYVEYARSFFPVILAVFVLRSFLVEPFQIPSSSMRPGLEVGDFILVNKFTYGLRMPITNQVVIPVAQPQHGDVMVFAYPKDPSKSFIKRVIGLPGDVVTFRDKQLSINGVPVRATDAGSYEYLEERTQAEEFGTGRSIELPERQVVLRRTIEQHGPHRYQVAYDDQRPTYSPQAVDDEVLRQACTHDDTGFTCTVPAGQYFTMGDNRDNSHDSRYWGFVRDDHIVGKAFFVWMNFSHPARIGTTIQ
jgi:signal peptidase I